MTSLRQFRNAFFKHGSAVFTCTVCKRATRDTGDGVNHLCHQCYELAGLDNTVNDDGRAPTAREATERDALLAEIAAKGGDVQRVIDANDFLFPAGYKLAPAAATAISSNLARAARKATTTKGKQTMNTTNTAVAAKSTIRKAATKPSKAVVTKPAAKAKPAKAKVQRAAKPSTFDSSAFDNALALAEAAVRKGAGACEIVRTVAAVKALERKDVMAIAEMVGVNKYTASRQFFLARHGE